VIAESILNRIISNAEMQLAGPNMRSHTAAVTAEELHAG